MITVARWARLLVVVTLAVVMTACSPAAVTGELSGPAVLPGPAPRTPSEPGPGEERNSNGRIQGTSPDRQLLDLAPSQLPGIGAALPGGVDGYRAQSVDWQPCGGQRECAEVAAPLDWADPADRSLTLALLKVPASNQPAVGTIFVNPGGPGQGGQGLAASFATDGLEDYDVIGWDPRGTGESTPVQCLDGPATDAFLEINPAPEDEAGYETYRQAALDVGAACAANSGDLLAHISTEDTVRDLDLMRHLVGDEKLTYLGYSYGTYIAAMYVHLFPENAGRIVLDAPVNISEAESTIQAVGFDRQLAAFTQWCAADADCRELGDTPALVLERVTALIERLRHDPVPVGDRHLTLSMGVSAILLPLYGGPSSWQYIPDMIVAAENGQGAPMLGVADQMNGRDRADEYDSLTYSFWAIQCVDGTDRGLAQAREAWAQDQRTAPFFGEYFGPAVMCEQWPVAGNDEQDITGAGAPGVLIVASTGDSATPYEEAVATHDALDGSVLVTREGDGHGSYGMGVSDCVDDHVVRYLSTGALPESDVTCS